MTPPLRIAGMRGFAGMAAALGVAILSGPVLAQTAAGPSPLDQSQAYDSDGAAAVDEALGVGPIPDIIRAYYALLTKDAADFPAEMSGLGVDHVLTLSELYPGTDFAEIDRKLAQGVTIVRKYRDLDAGRDEDLRSLVRTSSLAPDAKAALLAGFDQGLAETRPRNERHWALQEEGVETYRTIIALLARSSWILEGRRFVFLDPADDAVFKAQVRRIDAIAAEVDRMSAARDADRAAAVRELRAAAAKQ